MHSEFGYKQCSWFLFRKNTIIYIFFFFFFATHYYVRKIFFFPSYFFTKYSIKWKRFSVSFLPNKWTAIFHIRRENSFFYQSSNSTCLTFFRNFHKKYCLLNSSFIRSPVNACIVFSFSLWYSLSRGSVCKIISYQIILPIVEYVGNSLPIYSISQSTVQLSIR